MRNMVCLSKCVIKDGEGGLEVDNKKERWCVTMRMVV